MRFIKYLLYILLITSCKPNKTNQQEEQTETISITDEKHITNAPCTPLEKKAAEAVINWKAYQQTTKLIKKYYDTTIAEALLNATELADKTKELKASIKIKELQTPSMKARLNVLHNEALRLKDMKDIKSIKDEEVAEEVKKMLKVYNALNIKINSIYRISSYEIDINS